jgi:hypothetical protein
MILYDQRLFFRQTNDTRIKKIYKDMSMRLLSALKHLLVFNPLTFQHALPTFKSAMINILNVPAAAAVGVGYACAGFIDGKLWPSCKPLGRVALAALGVMPYPMQRAFYSGYKRLHGVVGQCITLPNGILFFYGPVEGRRHDSEVLQRSGILGNINTLRDAAGTSFWLLGDKGYPLRPYLMSLFDNPLIGTL